MKKTRQFIMFFLVVILAAAGFIAWELFGPIINVPPNNFFYVTTGSNYETVKENLGREGIVPHKLIFDKEARYFRYPMLVRPGRYKITEGMSLISLIRMLRSGNQSPINLVITKLRTKEDFIKKISGNFEADSSKVKQFINNPDSISGYDVDTNTVLTAIIPNTYTFNWNTPVGTIFKRLYKAQQFFGILIENLLLLNWGWM